MLDLNEEGVIAEALEQCDDRRHVFHVICVGSKKSIIMQAENQSDRDEVCVILGRGEKRKGLYRNLKGKCINNIGP